MKPVLIHLDEAVIAQLDERRGIAPRAAYVRKLLDDALASPVEREPEAKTWKVGDTGLRPVMRPDGTVLRKERVRVRSLTDSGAPVWELVE